VGSRSRLSSATAESGTAHAKLAAVPLRFPFYPLVLLCLLFSFSSSSSSLCLSFILDLYLIKAKLIPLWRLSHHICHLPPAVVHTVFRAPRLTEFPFWTVGFTTVSPRPASRFLFRLIYLLLSPPLGCTESATVFHKVQNFCFFFFFRWSPACLLQHRNIGYRRRH
jgi:hypothetical protein